MTPVLRAVRLVKHFDPKTPAELAEIAMRDPQLAALLTDRARTRKFGHDLIELKCGHAFTRVRPKKVHLWIRLPCDQCTRREAEMADRYAAGEARRTADRLDQLRVAEAARALGEEPTMATKKTTTTKKTGRSWNQSYAWVKALKLEPPAESVKGCIYRAMQKTKRGTAEQVTDAAVKLGLKTYTKQDPRNMTQSLLRQFAELGAVKIVRDGDAPAPAKAKATTGARKRLVLRKGAAPARKTAPASEGAQAGA